MGEPIDLRDRQFARNVARLHALGPRVLLEFLRELGARRTIFTEVEQIVARYARLDPAVLAALGIE